MPSGWVRARLRRQGRNGHQRLERRAKLGGQQFSGWIAGYLFRIETSLTPAIGRPVDPPIKCAGNHNGNDDDRKATDDAHAKGRYTIYKPNHEEMANVEWIRNF